MHCRLTKQLLLLTVISVWGSLFPATALTQHQTIGPGGCGLGQANCHATDNEWWKDDDHKFTVTTMYDSYDKYIQMAERAGIGGDNLFKGNSGCMDCHGTVISGNESNEVDEGVSCESCHGPGSGYKENHSEGDPNAGDKRSGYVTGLKSGMSELANYTVRAETCVRCHYITDEKVLRAGHPNGSGFNYVSGIRKVSKHWDRQPDSKDKNNAPFKSAMDKRGPAPEFVIKTEVGNQPPPNRVAAPPAPPRIVVADPFFPLRAEGSIELEPFPVLSDSASFKEIMLVLKARLELLYKKVR